MRWLFCSQYERENDFYRGLGLDPYEMRELATYNSEHSRGIVHTDAWGNRMSRLQTQYNGALEGMLDA